MGEHVKDVVMRRALEIIVGLLVTVLLSIGGVGYALGARGERAKETPALARAAAVKDAHQDSTLTAHTAELVRLEQAHLADSTAAAAATAAVQQVIDDSHQTLLLLRCHTAGIIDRACEQILGGNHRPKR